MNGKLGELKACMMRSKIEDMAIGKANKKNGVIEDFEGRFKNMQFRIKQIHIETDRMAKRIMHTEKGKHYDRKIGTLETCAIMHHEHLKDWHKSVNSLKERKRLLHQGGDRRSVFLREKHAKSKKNVGKTALKILNVMIAPKHEHRCCPKCKRRDNMCHVFFCDNGSNNNDWKSLEKTLRGKKIDGKELASLAREGKLMSSIEEEIDTSLMSNELKLLVKGMLPAGAIEQMINLKEEDMKATMNELWTILVNRVKKRNESKIELVEDKRVMNRLEEIKDLRRHSTKMVNLLSKESIDKIKKRKHRDFCVWERQIKHERRREKKMREREKGAMDKFLEKRRKLTR